MSLDKDYQYCENIIKENSASFYKAFKILPRNKRKAIYAIYAFCRLTDDCIDVHQDAQALEKIKSELLAFHAGSTPNAPVFRALRDVFNRYEMNITPFFELIEGQYKDLHFVQPTDQKELLEYCYLVAGTVGQMILPILATKNHRELKESAIQLGNAMQITNILRDVGEDLRRNRIYLPQNTLCQYNVDLKALEHPTPEFITVWESLAFESEQRYDAFHHAVEKYDKDAQIAIKQSAYFYRAILNSVRSNHYDCLNKRAHVSTQKKIMLAIKSRC